METEFLNVIVAVITHNNGKVTGGMAPIFHTLNKKESEDMAFDIAKVTDGMVHSLKNDIYVVVKH
jgi:hypothetical protein